MNKDKQISIRIAEQVRIAFNEYCKENGYSPSKRLRILIEQDTKGNIIIKSKS